MIDPRDYRLGFDVDSEAVTGTIIWGTGVVVVWALLGDLSLLDIPFVYLGVLLSRSAYVNRVTHQ